MALNPQFPNYANGPAGTEVIGWTVVGGQPLYRLPVAYVNTGFGAAFVCEGSTIEAPTFPDGVYIPDPNIESAGTISGDPDVGTTLTFVPGTISGTAPITAEYRWVRYIPGGTSLVVGTGLNYTVQVDDVSHMLIVQTIATNSVGSVGTQTVPYGPCVATSPVITDPGTITVRGVNVGSGGGAVQSITLVSPGEDYVYLLGAPTVDITGDGNGATATVTLAEEGRVVVTTSDLGVAQPGSSGTITYSGTSGETDIVLNWTEDGAGGITISIADPGSGWTQANATAAEQLTYGSRVVTNEGDWTNPPNIGLFIGVPIASVSLSTGGSGYTTASATVVPVAGDTYGNGATLSVTVAPSYCPQPGDVLEYSGATVFFPGNYTTFITWVNANNNTEVWQVGGDTFTIPDSAVGDEVKVYVVVYGVGAEQPANASSNTITVCGSITVVSASKISNIDPLYVGQGLTGVPARFDSYGPVSVSYGFVDVTDPNNPLPLGQSGGTNYTVTAADFGKVIAFRTIGTIGNLTSTSISDTVGPAGGYIDLVKQSGISYVGDTVNPGTTLTGTLAEFDAVPAITSTTYSFYRDDSTGLTPVWTPIGTPNSTTYVVQPGDARKDIVFGTTVVSPISPGGTRSLSNTVRPVNSFVFTTQGGFNNITRPGQPPHVGDQVEFVYPNSIPENNKHGGTVPLTGYFYSRISATQVSQVSTNPYTIPANWYGREFWQNFSASFEGRSILQFTDSVVIQGTAPVIGSGGSVTSSDNLNPFRVGSVATFNKPAVNAGVPAEFTETWTWYAVKAGGTRTALQNGGDTLAISKAMEGLLIEVDYKVTSVAGSDSQTYVASNVVPPATVYFTSIGQLSGSSKAFTLDDRNQEYLILTYSVAKASDGTSDPITITKQFSLCDSLGNPVNPSVPKIRDNYPNVNSITVYNVGTNADKYMAAPPGDPNQIPTPCATRYLCIIWTATNPKTGSTATTRSTPFGPFTSATSPYFGVTPPTFQAVRRPNTVYDCALTLPTFGNGGSIAVSSLEYTTGPSWLYPYGEVIATGTLTFPAQESDLYFTGLSVTGTISGPSGNRTWYALLTSG